MSLEPEVLHGCGGHKVGRRFQESSVGAGGLQRKVTCRAKQRERLSFGMGGEV